MQPETSVILFDAEMCFAHAVEWQPLLYAYLYGPLWDMLAPIHHISRDVMGMIGPAVCSLSMSATTGRSRKLSVHLEQSRNASTGRPSEVLSIKRDPSCPAHNRIESFDLQGQIETI